ncbi:MAG: hypothetical protein A2161_07390 [Candidatus Schekmanbacteria bacterium RBG_13_48_7]|uniref:Uncharacterized protein n=1 Tax=Candidatus Schekmanbacteria bacterium RBG_13_48_7 TaxID=1817878 RepID=A0A1F7RT45_9BACT|nr:MAG: hypothetical protein A2161_07390 [Candidatus Schekmanbacteria bacterium RBG_13_48_7]
MGKMKDFSSLPSLSDKEYIRESSAFNLDATHRFVLSVIKIEDSTPRREEDFSFFSSEIVKEKKEKGLFSIFRSIEKHWNILQNAVNCKKSNSNKEMSSAYRNNTKSSVLDQVICVYGSKNAKDRTSQFDCSRHQATEE